MIRLEESAKECPCCGASGKLEERGSSVPDPRYPDPKQIYCPDCNYRFRPDYRDYRRLCFPYVGVPTSGKTHSVLMVYDRVSSGRAARDLKLQRMELQSLMSSEEEKKFDKQVKVLFEEHKGPKGTPHLLPRPLTLLVRDADRTGRNSTLINLFDFAGEIMDKSVDTDVLRRRALQGDGFLLYLDPTQVSSTSGSNNLSVADQIRDLQRFYRDMCDAHKIKDGRIDIPVAVCVSKIDLLISDNPIGDGARDFIRVMQKTEGQPLTLEVLEERSRACKRILPVILPGFNLREMLGEMFGVRYLFFPLSPVSIVEGELGIKALRGRTILPFGIVEPIMWLLHMHGYQVFPKRTGKS